METYILHSIQHIAHLSCKYGYIWGRGCVCISLNRNNSRTDFEMNSYYWKILHRLIVKLFSLKSARLYCTHKIYINIMYGAQCIPIHDVKIRIASHSGQVQFSTALGSLYTIIPGPCNTFDGRQQDMLDFVLLEHPWRPIILHWSVSQKWQMVLLYQ